MIRIKRVYEPPAKDDGTRFLVERLWPRGMKKETLHMEAWRKEVSPGSELRRWFSHDPTKWKEFQRRYRAELAANRAACQSLLDAAKQGDITLLYSARETEHNNAVVLKSYLEERLIGKKNRKYNLRSHSAGCPTSERGANGPPNNQVTNGRKVRYASHETLLQPNLRSPRSYAYGNCQRSVKTGQ